MSLFIVGDTHGLIDSQKLTSKNFPNYKDCTKKDILLHLGDFGFFWHNDIRQQSKLFKSMLSIFENRNWGLTLVTMGNHENYNLLEQYPIVNLFGGKARQLSDSVFELLRGEIYIIDGLKILSCGGASSIDKFRRVRDISWFKQEELSFSDIENTLSNLEKHNYSVDLVLTHTCSKSTLLELSRILHFGENYIDSHNEFFDELKERVSYSHWYFGHMHIDRNISERETAVYNEIIKITT